MKRTNSFFSVGGSMVIISLALLASTSAVAATVYTWKDANGNTQYSDSPPPDKVKAEQREFKTSSSIKADDTKKEAAKTQETADDSKLTPEETFLKRQKDRKEIKEKTDQEAAAQKARKANCDRIAGNIAASTQQGKVYDLDKNGNKQFLDDGQRAKRTAELQKQQASECK